MGIEKYALGVSERTVQRWEAAKTVPNLAQHALEYVTMLLASNLDASSPTDSASGNTLGKLRLAPLKTNHLLRSRMTSLGHKRSLVRQADRNVLSKGAISACAGKLAPGVTQECRCAKTASVCATGLFPGLRRFSPLTALRNLQTHVD